jgi:hypothetical protein
MPVEIIDCMYGWCNVCTFNIPARAEIIGCRSIGKFQLNCQQAGNRLQNVVLINYLSDISTKNVFPPRMHETPCAGNDTFLFMVYISFCIGVSDPIPNIFGYIK